MKKIGLFATGLSATAPGLIFFVVYVRNGASMILGMILARATKRKCTGGPVPGMALGAMIPSWCQQAVGKGLEREQAEV